MALSPLLLKSLFGCVSVAGVGAAASFKIYQTYVASQAGTGQPLEKGTSSDAAKPLENETTGDAGKSSNPTTSSDTDKASKNNAASTPLQSSEDTPPVAANPVVLVKANTDFTAASKLSVGSTDNEYKCKVSGTDAATDFCRLVKLDIAKNWIDVNGIKKANSIDAVAVTDLQAEDNHFKLEVNTTLHSILNLSENKHIEIISSTDPNKKLAKLNVSFKVSGSEIDYVSTKHLLGRLETTSSSITAEDTHQCFLTTIATSPDASKACSIFSFGSEPTTLTGPRYHKQTVTNLLTTPPTAALTQHHNFVIEHTTLLTKTDIAANKTLYLKKLDNNTLSDAGKLANVVPVIIQGTNKKVFILSETPSYSIIVKKSEALESSKSISHTNSTKNYKCKLSSSDAFDCDLVDLGLSENKTSIDIAGIKNTDLTSPLSIQQSDTNIKYFKLDVPFTQFETIKTNLTSTPNAVELVEIIDASAKIGDLTPIFAIDDDNVPYFEKSTFLVKKAVISVDGAFDASKTHYCSFSTTGTPSETPTKCELIALGTGNLSATQEITATPTTTSITTQNNYLVKFTATSGEEITLPKASKDSNNLLFLEEGDDSAKTLVAKFNNQDIKEALLVDGENNKNHLFIFS